MSKVRLNILVEGQTEETFVRDLLIPYLHSKNAHLFVRYQVLYGVGGFKKIKKHLSRWFKYDRRDNFTTMIDFYEFPNDIEGFEQLEFIKDPYNRVASLERLLYKEISSECNGIRLIPYIQLHEFEAILYTDLNKFKLFYNEEDVSELKKEVRGYKNPELINGGLSTAPSKRILRHIFNYSKRTTGPQIAKAIGIDNIRKSCKHFNEWIEKIENLKD